ncbi:TetR/AcrR family transcriptional regulator [Kribbella solani]|uniref:AcrR family transcriptional regulator n=1 Tax=Kribbella solani TaxID=236067 RepID=A0A841DQV9_9ACTN|nr:TetR/AcrR family transcriptional regulator [Kribbella solani]MBB5980962.1 AcrR family transcriptional regulator [Kribbella solani]
MPSARGRNLTFTEEARRAQLVDVTIQLVAEHGYAATSLGRIAESAGITKAGVLYHFPSKQALVSAAHARVVSRVVAEVGAAVEAAGPAEAPAAYIRTMISHLHDHPHHVRMLIEAVTSTQSAVDSAERWRVVADLLATARDARGIAGELDLRSAALILGGGIDSIVAESLRDPAYDASAAAELLVGLVENGLLS